MPETPDVKSFGKLVRNRDEKIQELVVEPRDKMIKELQEQNSLLYLTLQSQVNTVERASKFEKERKGVVKIMYPILDEFDINISCLSQHATVKESKQIYNKIKRKKRN